MLIWKYNCLPSRYCFTKPRLDEQERIDLRRRLRLHQILQGVFNVRSDVPTLAIPVEEPR